MKKKRVNSIFDETEDKIVAKKVRCRFCKSRRQRREKVSLSPMTTASSGISYYEDSYYCDAQAVDISNKDLDEPRECDFYRHRTKTLKQEVWDKICQMLPDWILKLF